jgi:hypothetical protein
MGSVANELNTHHREVALIHAPIAAGEATLTVHLSLFPVALIYGAELEQLLFACGECARPCHIS